MINRSVADEKAVNSYFLDSWVCLGAGAKQKLQEDDFIHLDGENFLCDLCDHRNSALRIEDGDWGEEEEEEEETQSSSPFLPSMQIFRGHASGRNVKK